MSDHKFELTVLVLDGVDIKDVRSELIRVLSTMDASIAEPVALSSH